MRTGFGAINKTLEDVKAKQNQGGGGRFKYFNWKDGETKILRFLTDDVLVVDFYEMIVDNKGKFKDFISAPSLYQDDPSWRGEDWVLKYGGRAYENGTSGSLVVPKPKTRSVGVAVLREEAPREVDGRMVVTYQDHFYDDDGSPARWFGIVKQSLNLFWQQMSGYHREYGTICDRDYKIKRTGARVDTSYQIIPKDPDPDFDIKAFQESYGYGRVVDPATIKDDPERLVYCPQTIQQWAENYAGEERARFWLGKPDSRQEGGYSPSGNDEFVRATTSNPQPEADEAQVPQYAAPPGATDFSALRARLQAHK